MTWRKTRTGAAFIDHGPLSAFVTRRPAKALVIEGGVWSVFRDGVRSMLAGGSFDGELTVGQALADAAMRKHRDGACLRCKGRGFLPADDDGAKPCPACLGTGFSQTGGA